MGTLWLPMDSGDGGMIIRWEYADSEEHILAAVGSVPPSAWDQEDEQVYEIMHSPLITFDSVYPGSEIEESLILELALGRYRIMTCRYEPDSATSVVLHRFVKMD